MKAAFENVLSLRQMVAPEKVGRTPAIPEYEREEAERVAVKQAFDSINRAMLNEDLPELAATLAIGIHVLLGTAILYGIDLPEVWDACFGEVEPRVPNLSDLLSQQGPLA